MGDESEAHAVGVHDAVGRVGAGGGVNDVRRYRSHCDWRLYAFAHHGSGRMA